MISKYLLIICLLVGLIFVACSPDVSGFQNNISVTGDAAATYDAAQDATQEAWAAQWATESILRATENRAADYAQMTATIEFATSSVLTTTESAGQTATASLFTPTPTLTFTPIPLFEPFTVVDVAPDDMLNIHSEPSVSSQTIGRIRPFGQMIHINGSEKVVDNVVWVPVTYRGVSGWVNRSNLAQQIGSVDAAIALKALEIIYSLKNRDMTLFSTYVHPYKGVRFSPYTDVSSFQRVFTSEQVSNLLSDPTEYKWGTYDGTGNDIYLSFEEYFARFVYNKDYAQPNKVGFNEIIARGNTLNYIAHVYPTAIVIEYYLPGTPEYSGFDWGSLRLVLEQEDGIWYLVAIVHDEWTI